MISHIAVVGIRSSSDSGIEVLFHTIAVKCVYKNFIVGQTPKFICEIRTICFNNEWTHELVG